MSNDIRDRLPPAEYDHPECPDCSGKSRLYESTDCWCIPLFEIDRLRKELTTEQTLVMLGQVEIERLRNIIKAYVQAEREYSDDMEHLDSVPIRETWKEAWIDLAKEADND